MVNTAPVSLSAASPYPTLLERGRREQLPVIGVAPAPWYVEMTSMLAVQIMGALSQEGRVIGSLAVVGQSLLVLFLRGTFCVDFCGCAWVSPHHQTSI